MELSRLLCFQLPKNPHDPPPPLRIQTQHVDELGEVVDSLRPSSEELFGYRVSVGLVPDQQASEIAAARLWVAAVNSWGKLGHWGHAICYKRTEVGPAVTAALA